MHPAAHPPTNIPEVAEIISLRPIGPNDAEFLFRVYASTRETELAQVDWDDAKRESFLRMQSAAQSRHYAGEYPGAEFQVILADDQPAGRLYVHQRPDDIRVMDIALLPQFRGRGIGTVLMNQLLEEGARTSRTVSIHVEVFNPARHWYERLGFRAVASNGVYLLMERPPRGDGGPHSFPNP
jgi:ribosomal protein S18 acetylase RimI-like enzyme